MNSFFASLRKKVVSFLGPLSSGSGRVQYDAELLRKITLLYQLLSKQQKRNKEANTLLAELLKPLQSLVWDYPDVRSNLQTRQQMLQLCEMMLVALDTIAPAERFNYYKGVGYLIRRLEHGGVFLGGHEREAETGEEVAVCLQYRGVLFAALKQTAHTLSFRTSGGRPVSEPILGAGKNVEGSAIESVASSVVSTPNLLDLTPAVVQAYCAQILAVLAFRIPELMPRILKYGLVVTEEDLQTVHGDIKTVMDLLAEQMSAEQAPHRENSFGLERRSLLLAVGGAPHAGIRSDKRGEVSMGFYLQPFDENAAVPRELAEKCPGLFGWEHFHRSLEKLDTSNARTAGAVFEEIGVEWIQRALHRNSPIFHLFLKYWLEHCQLVEDAQEVVPHLSFRDLAPYRSLVRAFLVAFALEKDQRPRSMTDCAVALLGVEPGVITFLFRALFLSTDATDFAQVLDALMQCECWLKQLLADNESLPVDFDYDFLCVGFDRILGMEHHVVTARLLALIYNYSSVFSGDGRVKLFGGLLMGKYGAMLFLSWDVNTRSIFQQILVFRLLRQTRKQLQSQPVANSKIFEQDRILLTKQEALVRAIKMQADEKDPAKKRWFDPHWESYVPRAMEEWNTWMTAYQDDPEEMAHHKLQMLAKSPSFKA